MVSIVMTVHNRRTQLINTLKSIEYFEDYAEILGQSRVMIAECSRKCYTQKYTEAALSGCVIVGDRPLIPQNNINMIEATFPNVEQEIEMALANPVYAEPHYADKSLLFKEFESILDCF